MSSSAPHDLIALHTTDAVGSAAVRCGADTWAQEFGAQGQHAPVVLAAVLRLLEAAEVRLEALAGIAVTTGPGSFTGIRVGLATAQGLAAARGWNVWGCDSLMALAAVHAGERLPLAVVQDARRGEVYAALYDVRGEVPGVRAAPFCASPGVAAGRLAAALEAPHVHVVGSGVEILRAPLRDLGVQADTPMERRATPVARALLDLACAGGCRAFEARAVEPTYLRKSDAEIRRQAIPRTGGHRA